uniref:Fibrinogen C-terminal domain-containing protein n=1 Tax=Monopterus albus TaxID=43700 RepID=A0A3Q3KEP0_MONAL
MGCLVALPLAYLAHLLATTIASERQMHRMQYGPCSYTFILPEMEHCHPLKDFQVTNALQRDSPSEAEHVSSQFKQGKAQKERPSWQEKKLVRLESAMENNTQWLQKLENFIQENVHSGMEEMKRTVVDTQTAAMLEMRTNLLNQSVEQTRKLTDVETQVLNQTSHFEIQLLEYSLFTNQLEKHILLQTQQISRLSEKNSFLEQRLLAVEVRYGQELQGLQTEKQKLQELLEKQNQLVNQLQGKLGSSTLNSTLLQRHQVLLTDTVQQLLAMVNHCNEISNMPKEEPINFRDCAEILRSGVTESGIYSIRLPNSTQTVKVFCEMQTRGGGWTVLQHRRNGSVDFHRGWREYKIVSSYGSVYSTGQDVPITIHGLHAEGFTGTAGRTSSLTHTGTQFSTKDRDNDRCTCKCAQLASGGWWFEACGPSNLNGIYYPASSSVVRYNGIKWYYWKGPNLRATMTTMMVRPTYF